MNTQGAFQLSRPFSVHESGTKTFSRIPEGFFHFHEFTKGKKTNNAFTNAAGGGGLFKWTELNIYQLTMVTSINITSKRTTMSPIPPTYLYSLIAWMLYQKLYPPVEVVVVVVFIVINNFIVIT